MKILIIQSSHGVQNMMRLSQQHLRNIKKVVPKASVVVANNTSKDISQQSDADIIISSGFQKEWLNSFKNLQWVQVTSAGVNALPGELFDSKILITNASGVHPIPIAEQVFGYMLIFSRQLHVFHQAQIEKGEWMTSAQSPSITELSGKTLGIIGLGRIGERVAQLGKAFEMNILAIVRDDRKKVKNIDTLYTLKRLDMVIKQSDYIVNCLPSTSETQHLFTAKQFKTMKSSAYFINIGRGDTVVETDLVDALKSNRIAGAGLDVFETEPLPSSSPLWKLSNVIITPHTAGWTPSYMDRVIDIFCNNLQAFLKKQKMPTLVDKKRGY